jgi:hypothetical protein
VASTRVATLRAALWAARSVRQVRRDLSRHGVHAQVPPPPSLPDAAGRGVVIVLRRTSPTCIEQALVMQRWLVAHGQPHDVVIGVARHDDTVMAHAWVDGGGEPSGETYTELHRLPPPGPARL